VADSVATGDTLEFWREEILRRAGEALQGRVVGLFEERGGMLEPVLVGLHRSLPPTAGAEIDRAVRQWRLPIPPGSRWLACRLDMGRWCVAPVRSGIPPSPPGGTMRRRKERTTLELAGLCLGLVEERLGAAGGGEKAAPG